jgi:hypothetical protein
MIQPSIHKRDIESSRMVVCGAFFDMRDLAQMLLAALAQISAGSER